MYKVILHRTKAATHGRLLRPALRLQPLLLRTLQSPLATGPRALFASKPDKEAAAEKPKEAAASGRQRKASASAEVAGKKAVGTTRKPRAKAGEKDGAAAKPVVQLYTLKFNSPILPFAKFPLTQNKYIQDFLRKYDEDKDKIQKVIGVHFVGNNNANAQDTVGIEIEITKRNNITIVESNSNKRYKIKAYDEISNFCQAEEFEDAMLPTVVAKNSEVDPKYKDLLMSELYELKNIWFMFNKKINSMLVILPQEILNRYDMVAKTLQPPVFDVSKYPTEGNFLDTFDEIVYKLA